MKTAKTILALVAAVLMAGCVPSLQPLYTEKDLVFEPALLGAWVGKDGKGVWTFEKAEDKAYKLTYSEGHEPTEFEAHLVRLGNSLFLDTGLSELKMESDLARISLLPCHTFFKIKLDGETLNYALLNYDWCKKMADEKKLKVRHERWGEKNEAVLLTAPTEELQMSLLENVDIAEAFGAAEKLQRRK